MRFYIPNYIYRVDSQEGHKGGTATEVKKTSLTHSQTRQSRMHNSCIISIPGENPEVLIENFTGNLYWHSIEEVLHWNRNIHHLKLLPSKALMLGSYDHYLQDL
jgi:hypothetical protein